MTSGLSPPVSSGFIINKRLLDLAVFIPPKKAVSLAGLSQRLAHPHSSEDEWVRQPSGQCIFRMKHVC